MGARCVRLQLEKSTRGQVFYKMGLGKLLAERSTDTVEYECLQLCLKARTMTEYLKDFQIRKA